MREHKSYGIPAPAHRARQNQKIGRSSRSSRNPFLSTCCAVTKTRSLGPLPYVNWMRIAGGYGSAHIKIGQGLLYEPRWSSVKSWDGKFRGDAGTKTVLIYVKRLHNRNSFGEWEGCVIVFDKWTKLIALCVYIHLRMFNWLMVVNFTQPLSRYPC